MNNALTDLVNGIQTEFVQKDLVETSQKHKFKPKKDDSTETVFDPTGTKVVVPGNMSKLQASYNLLQQFKEEETLRNYNRSYPGFFMNDFMIAMKAMTKKYFGQLHVSKRNTDGEPVSADYIQIPMGFDSKGKLVSEQGYVGSILAPVWEDAIIDISPAGHLTVRAKLKYEKYVNNFLAEIEQYIKSNSVVAGGCFTPKEVRGGMIANPINPKVNPRIVLDNKTERVVSNILIPSMKNNRKTSLLLTGDYGTGKTETAIRIGVAAKEEFGRTFFYLHNAELFGKLIPYLKNYQKPGPVVFVEDVDQISSGDRDTHMNDLLNQLDGNELKNVDVTFIFTTNNHDKIHPAMRRPGRIDQVVHFGYADQQMIERIYALYASGRDGAEEVDYAKAAAATLEMSKELQGAVVAEISRRACEFADNLYEGTISTERFLDAVASMDDHIKFMKKEQEKDHSVENLWGHLVYRGMMQAFPNLGEDSDGVFDGSSYEGLNS